MRWARLGAAVALAGGCTPPEPQDVPAPTSDAPPTVLPPTPPPTAPISPFREGTWLVDTMHLLEEADTNGDGTDDNKLPAVLVAVDILLNDANVSVASLNSGIAVNLASYATVVFIDGRSDGDALELDVLPGVHDPAADVLYVAPEAYNAAGLAISRLQGAMTGAVSYDVTGRLYLPVVFLPDTPPIPVRMDEVRMAGELDQGLFAGRLRGAIPVQAFVDEVVAPLVPPEGLEITPGEITPHAEVMALIEALAPGLADVELQDGAPAVSAVFEVAGADQEPAPAP